MQRFAVFLCVLLVNSTLGDWLQKLSYEENEKRDADCGIPEDPKQFDRWYVRPRDHGGRSVDVGGGVLITRKWMIFPDTIHVHLANMFNQYRKTDTLKKCEDRTPSPLAFYDGELNAAFAGDKNNDYLKLQSKYFYGNCTSIKGFILAQYNVHDFDRPACILDDESSINLENAETYAIIGDSNFKPAKFSGKIQSCSESNGSLCWFPTEKQDSLIHLNQPSNKLSGMPIFTKEKKTMFIGFGYNWNTTCLFIRDFRDDAKVLCEILGICKHIPTTTLPTTTTTTTTPEPPTTTPPPPSTEPYAPALLLDDEMKDFEMDYYHASNIAEKGARGFSRAWSIWILILSFSFGF